MAQTVAYCGTPPVPGDLATRLNTDPLLIAALLVLAGAHVLTTQRRTLAVGGWAIVATVLILPLCALSVALFSARVGQHMILLLVAAPMLALALPRGAGRSLWPAVAAFGAALWFWHMPTPYDATLASAPVYWAMHLTLFGSGVWLWRELFGAAPVASLAAGTFTSVHMGLLGAVLALASHPLFAAHLLTSEAWGLTPLADQQLGGLFMWVPGALFFLWAAMRSLTLLWRSLEQRPA
jgi:putative membrane protein